MRHITSVLAVSIILCGGLVAGAAQNMVAHAMTTQIGSSVRDNKPPSLAVANPVQQTIASSQYVIVGAIYNIDHIQVDVDGVFSTVLALDAGSTRFSVPVDLTVGSHIVTVRAFDAYTTTELTRELSVTYAPSTREKTPPHVPIQSFVTEQVVASGETAMAAAQSQLDAAANDGPLKSLTEQAYISLSAVGLISPLDIQGVTAMESRFVSVLVGMIIVILPNTWLRCVGRKVAYPRWLRGRGRLLAMGARCVGIVLICLPFLGIW